MRRSRSLAALLALGGALAFGAGGGLASTPPKPLGKTQVAALLRGIPQHGVDLGSPKAPVTLVEFADLQCPYCAIWERNALPVIVRKYVRPGKVRIVFVGMGSLGPDSTRAFRAALAAGRQNRLWNLVELLYLNQGKENTNWVTDARLRAIGKLVPGLDVRKMMAARGSAAVTSQVAAASSLASSAGVTKLPSFAAGRTNGSLRLLEITSLDAISVEPAIDALLEGLSRSVAAPDLRGRGPRPFAVRRRRERSERAKEGARGGTMGFPTH